MVGADRALLLALGASGRIMTRNDAEWRAFGRFGGRNRANIAAILREWRAVGGGALGRSQTI